MIDNRKRITYDQILKFLSILGLVCSFYPLFFYGNISDDTLIPIHYNRLGEVDGWGNRHFFWIISLIVIAIYIGISIVEKYPNKINYPVKVTAENKETIHKIGVQLVRHIKFVLMFVFAYINYSTYNIAVGKSTGLNKIIMAAFIVGLFFVLFFFTLKMFKHRKKTFSK